MSPKDVWVIYNKFNKEIVWVAAEHFLASRKWEELHDGQPLNLGFESNKFVVCTLSRALKEIDLEYKAEIDYLKEEYDLSKKYLTT